MKGGEVNPFFYGIVVIFLIGLHSIHVQLVSPETQFATLFFTIHAVFQSIIEFLFIYLFALFFKKRFHFSLYYTFVALVFTLLMTHIADFVLVRIMGMTFFSTLDLILDETLANFIEMLQLTGIPLPYWGGLALFALVVLPSAALCIYFSTRRFFGPSQQALSARRLSRVLLMLPFVLLAVDVAFLPFISKREYIKFAATLPFKTTVLPFPSEKIELTHSIHKPVDSPLSSVTKQDALPNIYLWVVESLREDYVTEKTAPHVVSFREKHISLPYTVSGGNGTQLSWYSIFHSNSAVHWAESRGAKQKGAIPLRILKEMGYDINVYAAAQLKYYEIDELLFGKNCNLLTENHAFPHYPPKEAYESDVEAFNTMMHDMKRKDKSSGNVFVLFLDSTHFEYSWPPTYPAPFDTSSAGSHIQVASSDASITHLKNCYKNSIHFVDSLFGQFTSALKDEGLYDSSVVVFTGDHGEEFYEEGRLYHASHLSAMQTTPPIYYKLGSLSPEDISAPTISISSHVDIFPTILDYLSKSTIDLSFCDGMSLLQNIPHRYAVVARFNGNRSPYEFYVHDGKVKCLLQFDKKKGIYGAKWLHIIHFFDRNEDEIETLDGRQLLKQHFAPFLSNTFKG